MGALLFTIAMVGLQAPHCGANLEHALGIEPPFYPRNLGPSWPSSEPTALAQRLLGMCRGPRDSLHPFAYWVMAPWEADGRDDQEPLQAVEIEPARLFRCNIGYPVQDEPDTGWPVKDFLNIVWLLGLRAVIGLDAALYAQSSRTCQPQRPCGPPGICYLQRYGCYDNARIAWRRMLQSGLVEEGRYHPALEFVILASEPDVAVPLQCQLEGTQCAWPQILRGVLSSWDAILDAEHELGVQGTVNVTVTFNVTENVSARGLPKCYFLRVSNGGCAEYHDMRNMWLAANNLLNDSYEPHNDLSDSYRNRWMHSLHSKMAADRLKLHLQEFYSFISPIHQAGARLLAFYPA